MREKIVELRRLLMSHKVAEPYIVVQDLLNILAGQDRAIQDLIESNRRSWVRTNNQIAALQAEINRLKGVHGA